VREAIGPGAVSDDLNVVRIVVDSKGVTEAAAQLAQIDDGRARRSRFGCRDGMVRERRSDHDGGEEKIVTFHVCSLCQRVDHYRYVFADHLAQLGKPLKPGEAVTVICEGFERSALMV
jgi:hypothetical protein